MSDDGGERRAERDSTLVRGFCAAASDKRLRLVAWIEEELQDQRIAAQLIQEIASGLIRSKAIEYVATVDDMDHRQLPDAIKAQKLRVTEVQREFDDDPFSDYMYLEESTLRLEKMAMMIFRMRRVLDDLSGSTPTNNLHDDGIEGDSIDGG